MSVCPACDTVRSTPFHHVFFLLAHMMRKMVDLQLMRHRVLLEACALCALCLLVAAWRVPCSVTTEYLPLKARKEPMLKYFQHN